VPRRCRYVPGRVYTSIIDGLMGAHGHSSSLFSTFEPWERDVLKLMVESFADDTVTEED